jgi:hypothetical protein
VLARVNQALLYPRPLLECPQDRRGLHEIRSSPYYMQYVHSPVKAFR